jgi:hypothetical protein
MRRTAECSLLQQLSNEDILEELDMDQSQKKLEQYKQNWLNIVRRIKDIDTQNKFLTVERTEDRYLDDLSNRMQSRGRSFQNVRYINA